MTELETPMPVEAPSAMRLGEIDQAIASQFEGEIREFVRRDVSLRRRLRQETRSEAAAGFAPHAGGDQAIESVDALIQRVSGATIDEIEAVIAELQAMRDSLRSEGLRIRRELSDFAGLSQTAMLSVKMVAENLAQCRAAMTPARVVSDAPALQDAG